MVPRAHVGTPLAGSKRPVGLPRALDARDGVYALPAVLGRRRMKMIVGRAISTERDQLTAVLSATVSVPDSAGPVRGGGDLADGLGRRTPSGSDCDVRCAR